MVLAIGAATRPPVASEPRSPPFSTSTATAYWRSPGWGTAGAKPTNHACGCRPSATWAVPVLPATWIPSICAAVPVPWSTTPIMRSRTVWATSGVTGVRATSGWVLSTTLPSTSRIWSTTWGRICWPPLAMVAATIAIWSGDTDTSACPMAAWANSGWLSLKLPIAGAVPLAARRSKGTSSPMPHAWIPRGQVVAEVEPDLAEHRVARLGEALGQRAAAGLAAEVRQRAVGLGQGDLGLDRERGLGRDHAQAERRGGRHDLERRPRWEALAEAARQHRVGVAGVQRGVVGLGRRDVVARDDGRVEGRLLVQGDHRARLRVEHDHRALPAVQRVAGELLGPGVDGELDRPRADPAAQQVDDVGRPDLGVAAGELVVVDVLDVGGAVLERVEAGDVAEQGAVGVRAQVLVGVVRSASRWPPPRRSRRGCRRGGWRSRATMRRKLRGSSSSFSACTTCR